MTRLARETAGKWAILGCLALTITGCESEIAAVNRSTDIRASAIVAAKLKDQFAAKAMPGSIDGVTFNWSGADYDSLDLALAKINHDFGEELNAITPVATPIEGRLRIVTPTPAMDVVTEKAPGPRGPTIATGFAAYDQALDAERIEALRRAHLFAEITQAQADGPLSAPQENQGYLLRREGRAWQLSYDKSPAVPVSWSGLELNDWIAAVQNAASVTRQSAPKDDAPTQN